MLHGAGYSLLRGNRLRQHRAQTEHHTANRRDVSESVYDFFQFFANRAFTESSYSFALWVTFVTPAMIEMQSRRYRLQASKT